MNTRNTLRQELQQKKVVDFIISTAVASGLADVLADSEIIDRIAQCSLHNVLGVLTLTNRRVVFCSMSREETVKIYHSELISVSHESNWLSGELSIHSKQGGYVFTGVTDPDKGKSLAEALKHLINQERVHATNILQETEKMLPAPAIIEEESAKSVLDADAIVSQAIQAFRDARKEEARELLTQAIKVERYHEQAWLWLSGVVALDEERIKCLEMVLMINPRNEAARKGMAILRAANIVIPQASHDSTSDSNSNSATEYCRYCGKKIFMNSQFCLHCGKALSSKAALTSDSIETKVEIHAQTAMKQFIEEKTIREATIHFTRKSPSDWIGGKKLIITSKRVIWRSGIIGKSEESILLSKAQNVSVKYGLAGKAMGYGSVYISGGKMTISANDIVDPEGIKNLILSLIE